MMLHSEATNFPPVFCATKPPVVGKDGRHVGFAASTFPLTGHARTECEALRSFRLEKLKVYTSNHCQQIPGSNMTCEGAVLSDRSWSQDTFPKVEPKHYVWLLLRLPNKLSPCCGRISCAFFFEDTQPWPLTILKEISCRPLAAAVHSYPSCTVTRIH